MLKGSRRKQFVVNAHLQRKVILSAIYMGECIIFLTVLFVYLMSEYVIKTYASSAVVLVIQDSLKPVLFYSAMSMGIVGGITMGVWGFLLSHRIAGPIFRLERICNHIADGDLCVRVAFRKKDMLRPLKDTLQYMIASLRERARNNIDACNDIDQLCQMMKKDIEVVTDNSKRNQLLGNILVIENSLNKIKASFTLSREDSTG